MKTWKPALLVFVASLVLSVLFVVFGVSAQLPKASGGLAIEIETEKGLFYLPVPATGKRVSIQTLVSHDKSASSLREQVSAVRIIPQMEGNKVKLTIDALYGDTSSVKSCDEWNALEAKTIVTFVAGEGEEVSVPGLIRYGVRFGDRAPAIRVVPRKPVTVPVSASTVQEDCICGICRGQLCCGEPGVCIHCTECSWTICCFG